MRLEKLCDMDMYYRGEGVWLRPFGEKEAAGFGSGDGEVRGERLRGRMVWSNHPRRREDGVWCPDCHGYITTEDGAQILVSIRGYSVREETPDVRRAILTTVSFQASDPRYRWLNFVIGVGEGEIEENPRDKSDLDHWWLHVYACVNEVAKAPPAIR
ncbi:MAG: DUF3237 family protein [Euryarchaeota archaeon]|nr:DUF3237 family protein [Euryarchaeota archaeon]